MMHKPMSRAGCSDVLGMQVHSLQTKEAAKG